VESRWRTQLSLVNAVCAAVLAALQQLSYSQALAVCLGPLDRVRSRLGLFSPPTAPLPGGRRLVFQTRPGLVARYAAWSAGCTSYACGGARGCSCPGQLSGHRGLNRSAVGMAATSDGGATGWSPPTGGFLLRRANFYGSTAAWPSTPSGRHGDQLDDRCYWLVASDGGSSPFTRASSARRVPRRSTPGGRHGRDLRWGATGRWPPTGASSPSRRTLLRLDGGRQLNAPSWGCGDTRWGGYWEWPRGGIFTFGDAHFAGRGREALNARSWAWPRTRRWLLAGRRDGGIFAFAVPGSTGRQGHGPQRPVVAWRRHIPVAATGWWPPTRIFVPGPFYGSPA